MVISEPGKWLHKRLEKRLEREHMKNAKPGRKIREKEEGEYVSYGTIRINEQLF
jgi:hypothetical protein